MSVAMSGGPSPEERELERKRSRLELLKGRLAEQELILATAKGELAVFEERYLREIGTRYAELDNLEARIAEALARLDPSNRVISEEAKRARGRAQRSSEEAAANVPGNPEVVEPSDGLKHLYREAAKKIHPDLARDDISRGKREGLMVALNTAYQRGDEAGLRAIVSEWERSPEAVSGGGVEAELVRVIRQIARVEERLREIQRELAELTRSGQWQLRKEVVNGAEEGRDVLAAIAANVDGLIADARRRLDRLEVAAQ
jgi:hypothetical protein